MSTRSRGRPSLGEGGVSPQLRTRVSAQVAQQVQDYAASRGTTVAALIRTLVTSQVHQDTRELRVQRELHLSVLARLVEDPDAVRERGLRNLENMRHRVRGSQAQGWLNEWQTLLSGPADDLVSVLLARTERANDLRQVSPFIGVLTQEQRLAAIARAAGGDHAA